MAGTPTNALDITAAGLVKFDGTATFSGVTTTNHDVLVGAASNGITNVAPSATSGVPLVSNGASADPSFTTAVVAGGGTGATSFTAYSVLCGGTTSTGTVQNVSGVGTSGQILTSNGASALPTWQTGPAGSGAWIQLSSQTASASSSLTFTSIISATYTTYVLVYSNVSVGTDLAAVEIQVSNDNGSTYKSTSYQSGVAAWSYNSVSWSNASSTSAILLISALHSGLGNDTMAGYLYMYNVGNGGNFTTSGSTNYFNTAAASQQLLVGRYADTGINAFKVIASSGTFSGKFVLYGITGS